MTHLSPGAKAYLDNRVTVTFCGGEFTGDKRAWQCEPCAIESSPLPSSVEEKTVYGNRHSRINPLSNAPSKEMSAEEFLRSVTLPHGYIVSAPEGFPLVTQHNARHYANLRAAEAVREFARELEDESLYKDVSGVHDEIRDYCQFNIAAAAESYINKKLKG